VTEKTAEQIITQQILFRTIDPTVVSAGGPMPAMTTMLIRVCNNDPVKFEEACRLIELFIEEALK